MPHATLLAITSPMLLAPLPPVGMVEPGLAATHASVLPLSWSLAQAHDDTAQTQETGPQDRPQDIGPVDEADSQESPESGTEGQSEIVVEGEYGPPANDPVAVFNETSYRITQDLDGVFVEPVAYAYRDALPDQLRDGLGNVVRNLSEPSNFLNFLLQLKIGKAFETLGRFAINSTLGIGGVFDIAEKPGVGLPYRRNGFANTLGFYGVDTGAYLYLPITGATTVRDLIGSTLDQAVLPFAVGAPFDRLEYTVPYYVISNLDARLEADQEMIALDNTVDPYTARRDTYLARRAREIALLRGEEPPETPAILEELENELECGDIVCDDNPEAEAGNAPDTAPPPPSPPAISARELPPINHNVVITQPALR